ncbi:MAG: DUF1015 domain-containing protein [Nocardioidaceae bacterium]
MVTKATVRLRFRGLAQSIGHAVDDPRTDVHDAVEIEHRTVIDVDERAGARHELSSFEHGRLVLRFAFFARPGGPERNGSSIECSVPSKSAARSTLQLSPFVAMRYNPDLISDLGDVTSPPYDVMDRSMIDSLLAGHPNNVVRLILPRLVTDPMAGQDPYARAANRMLRWREQSVLISDDQPALFVYEYGDAQHRMCGLIGAIGLREPQERVILPHEDVIEAIVEDRVAMLTAQEANLEPIMLTYDGEGEISDLIAEAQKQQPLVDVSLSDQTYHRIWRITDVEDLQRIANHLAPRQALIADGHHRYAAYLQCRTGAGCLHE